MSKNKKKNKQGMPAQAQSKQGAPGASDAQRKSKPSSRQQTGFFQRLVGVITFNRAIYREIAEDPGATMQATIVVVVVALVVGAINYYASTQLPGLPASEKPLARSIVMVIQALLVWLVGAFVIAQVARYLFRGNTNTSEMLRVFGFAQVFMVLLVLGVFSRDIAQLLSIAGLVLTIIGAIVGIREAGEFSTGKAVVTGVFGIVLVSVLVAFFVGFVLNPFVTTLLPT